MNKIHKTFVTFFGSGYLPIAPGTWGSFFACIFIYLLIKNINLYFFVAIILLIFILGTVVSDIVVKKLNVNDPRWIVIDEVAGMMTTFLPLYYIDILNIKIMVAGFVFFRIFDVFKPPPIRLIDRKLKNGFGIMFDDIIAGVYAAIVLYFIRNFFR